MNVKRAYEARFELVQEQSKASGGGSQDGSEFVQESGQVPMFLGHGYGCYNK